MKDVFRRLAEWLGIDKDGTPTEEGIINRDEHSIHPDVHVRTRTVYPRGAKGGEFRFPVIPDERLTRDSSQRALNVKLDSSANIHKPIGLSKTPTVHHAPSQPSNSIPPKKKFQPSEIISPVYGRMPFDGSPKEKTQGDKEIIHESTIVKKNDVIEGGVQELIRKSVLPPDTSEKAISERPHETVEIANLNRRVIEHLEKPVPEASPADDQATSHLQPPSSAKVIAFPKRSVPVETGIETEIGANDGSMGRAEGGFKPSGASHSFTNEVKPVHEKVETLQAYQTNHPDPYQLPSTNMLGIEPQSTAVDDSYLYEQIDKLTLALENFNVKAEVIGVVKGPTVTRYELQPAPGVKVNKFTNLIDDIKLALAAKDIRMEAPIPGRSAIGIEVPNEVSSPVFIRSILDSDEFRGKSSPLSVALGRDISGAPVIGDLKKMPHGLIAGATGSGKSVCINSIIVSLLFKAKPSEVRMILIDPKVVELAPYNHIPHLLTPVVTDPKQATAALKWAVEEMDKRYERFAESGARDIERYNSMMEQEGNEKLPYIVIVIDELADLMMVSPHDVEEAICRIAQKARACGIHLLVATQRPSVDVITGLIKANIPTRVAFSVSSQADSRTILDMGGAERLLGKGDMLYYPSGQAKPVRLQGNFVSDDEIEQVVEHVKQQQKTVYLFDKEELNRAASSNAGDQDDELFEEALLFTIEQGQASSSSLQRRFRIGYNRAARLIDLMEAEGYVSGQSGSKPREVLISMDDYYNLFG